MPSDSNHSPGSSAVSSAGLSAPESAGELGPLDALIVDSEQAAQRFAADLDSPRYQAALADLAAQSDRAAAALFDLEQATGGLLPPGRIP